MEIHKLTSFFMWCTVINVSLFTLWAMFFMFAPGLVYRTQNKWFPIPRETFNVVFYSFLGFFKVILLVFNIVPYVALLIIGQ